MANQEKAMLERPVGELITRGRLELVFKANFFSELALALVPIGVPDDSEEAKRIWKGNKPTMATDGKSLYFAEGFIRTLTFKQMLYIFLHEGLHYGLGHPLRLRGYNPDIMNLCADIIVNQMLDDSLSDNGLERPADIVDINLTKHLFHIPQGMTYRDLPYKFSCEELYQLFVKKSGEDGGKAPKPGWGYVIEQQGDDGSELTDEEIEQRKIQTSIELAAAADKSNARKPGSVPGSIQDELNRMRKPVVNWRKHLIDFMIGGRPMQSSWARLNKRYRHIARLPHLKKKEFGQVVIFIDTSGSVGDEYLEKFLGEINSISNMANFEEIITVPVDYVVHEKGVKRFKQGQRITSIRVDGRGGTSFRPGFEWLKKQTDINPVRIIYMTDMEGDFPSDPYPVKTLWLATTNITAPWGTTIKMEKEGK